MKINRETDTKTARPKATPEHRESGTEKQEKQRREESEAFKT